MIKFGTAMTVYAALALLDLAVASGVAPAPWRKMFPVFTTGFRTITRNSRIYERL